MSKAGLEAMISLMWISETAVNWAWRHAVLPVHGDVCTQGIQMCNHGPIWGTQATTFLISVKVPAYNQEVSGL